MHKNGEIALNKSNGVYPTFCIKFHPKKNYFFKIYDKQRGILIFYFAVFHIRKNSLRLSSSPLSSVCSYDEWDKGSVLMGLPLSLPWESRLRLTTLQLIVCIRAPPPLPSARTNCPRRSRRDQVVLTPKPLTHTCAHSQIWLRSTFPQILTWVQEFFFESEEHELERNRNLPAAFARNLPGTVDLTYAMQIGKTFISKFKSIVHANPAHRPTEYCDFHLANASERLYKGESLTNKQTWNLDLFINMIIMLVTHTQKVPKSFWVAQMWKLWLTLVFSSSSPDS